MKDDTVLGGVCQLTVPWLFSDALRIVVNVPGHFSYKVLKKQLRSRKKYAGVEV